MVSVATTTGKALLFSKKKTALPAGAVGLWYADQYDAATKASPNAAVGGSPSTNIFRGSRRIFSNTEWWAKAGTVTIVDDAAVGPDGLTEASTVNASGNWTLGTKITTYNLPAGTYTVAVNAMRNTGSDQPFCFTKDNTSTRSSQQTATSAWQRFSYTFTLASPATVANVKICSIDGSTAANIQICDFELYAGSSDLGPATLAGHLYIGANFYDTRPSYAAGVLDMSANGYGIIQFPTAATIGNFTTQACISKTAAGGGYDGWQSRVQNYQHFSALLDVANIPNRTTVNNGYGDTTGTSGCTQAALGLWSLLSKGYHVLTHRYNGTQEELWIDDIRMFVDVGALSTFSLRDLFFNIVNSTTLYGGLKYIGHGLWDRAWTDAEIRSSVAYWTSRAAKSAVTLSSVGRVIVIDGDSRTSSAHSYVFKFGPNASPAVLGCNYSVSGSTLANAVARIAGPNGTVPPNKNGRKFIAVVGQLGANDLAGYPGATDIIAATAYAAAMGAYTDALYAAGFDNVVLCTEPAVGSGTNTHNTRRNILNPIYRSSYPGARAIAICDFAADATMGTDTSFTDNPADWTDSTHQSDAGDVIYETILRATVNAL